MVGHLHRIIQGAICLTLIAACSEPTEPAPEPVSLAHVVVVGGAVAADIDVDHVHLSLRNEGGAGGYFIQYWGRRTDKIANDYLLLSTSAFEVGDSREPFTVTRSIQVTRPRAVEYVVVSSGPANTGTFPNTVRYSF